MNIEIIGKFYDNHSLSIVNRNIALHAYNNGCSIRIIPLDQYDPKYRIDKEDIGYLKDMEQNNLFEHADIQLRHSYPPMWQWPTSSNTKIVYIQPWEYSKAPFEWQYKFERFADALIVPSHFCKNVFIQGGINPDKIFVIPNGINPQIYNTEGRTESDKLVFTYVGNSQWRKGLDILLTAWARVFRKADNVKLVIKDNPSVYGKTNLLQNIVSMQYYQQCGQIQYIDDDLSDSEMAQLYKQSQFVVHPYRAEGFGMHVQEAIACGCVPIIPVDGPTDDFVNKDQAIFIPVNKKIINITEPSIFAIKPGDSTTLMGGHAMINEPSIDHLANILHKVYIAHNRQELLNNLKSKTKSPNLWMDVAMQYINILTHIYERDDNVTRYS